MIKLTRSTCPKQLLEKGIKSAKCLTDRYELDKIRFNTTKADFLPSIYSHSAVKVSLAASQNKKCCYSEIKFPADYPEVEHYRPKGKVNIRETKIRQKIGYYWLCYTWENLVLCKSKINRKYKKTFFPLEDESKRSKIYTDGITRESPLLIDPFAEDPRNHINFYKEEPKAITRKGSVSIKYYGLLDPDIHEHRKTFFERLLALKEARDALEGKRQAKHLYPGLTVSVIDGRL